MSKLSELKKWCERMIALPDVKSEFLYPIEAVNKAYVGALKEVLQKIAEPEEEDPRENSVKYCKCPQCKKFFKLNWNDYTKVEGEWAKQTLFESSCPSGGTYAMSIECPHCDFEERL